MMEFSRNNNLSDDEWMTKMSASMNQSVDQELLRRLRASSSAGGMNGSAGGTGAGSSNGMASNGAGAGDGSSTSPGAGSGRGIVGMMQHQQQDQQGQQQQQQRQSSQQNGGSSNGNGNDQAAEEELLLQLLYQRRRRQQQIQDGMGGAAGAGAGGSIEDYHRFGASSGNAAGGDSTGNPMTNLLSSEEEQLQKLRDQQQQAATVVSRRNSLLSSGGGGGGAATERRTSMLSSFSDTSAPAGPNMSGTNTSAMYGNRSPTQTRGTGSISPFNTANGMMSGAGGNIDGASSMRRPSMMGGIGNMAAQGSSMFSGMGGLSGMSGMGNMGNMGGLSGMGGMNGMGGMGGMMDPFHQDPYGPMGVGSSQSASEYLNPQRVDISSSRLLALQRQQDAAGMMMPPSGLFSSMNGVHPNSVGSSFLMDRERMMDLNLYGHTRDQLAQAQAHTEKLLLREQLQHRQLQQNQMQNGANIKKKRAPARKKAPTNKPRRPLSAYNLFFSEERERILKEIDDKAALERGEEPKKEGEDDGDDKEKSADGETSGEAKEGDETKTDGESKKRKIPKAFLRPLLPGQRKRRAHRKTHGKISFRLLAQMVGARWKALPDDERKYYQDLAKEDSIRQKEAMKEYYRMEQRQQEDPTATSTSTSTDKPEPGSDADPGSSIPMAENKLEPEPIVEMKDDNDEATNAENKKDIANDDMEIIKDAKDESDKKEEDKDSQGEDEQK